MPNAKINAGISGSKPVRRLKQLLTAGNIWLYVLSVIKKDGKAYAYALDGQLEHRFFFRPSRVMIYLVLYRLEGEGLIRSEMEERRKYYRLTKKGADALKFAKDYLNSLGKEL